MSIETTAPRTLNRGSNQVYVRAARMVYRNQLSNEPHRAKLSVELLHPATLCILLVEVLEAERMQSSDRLKGATTQSAELPKRRSLSHRALSAAGGTTLPLRRSLDPSDPEHLRAQLEVTVGTSCRDSTHSAWSVGGTAQGAYNPAYDSSARLSDCEGDSEFTPCGTARDAYYVVL